MRKLNAIVVMLQIAKWAVVVLLSLAILVLWTNEKPQINLSTNYVTLDDPLLENEVESVLRFGDYQLIVTDYDLLFPSSNTIKLLSSLAGLLVMGYIFWGLQLIIRLVKDVAGGRSFTVLNTSRLKRLAALVFFAPLLMELLQQVFLFIFTAIHTLPEELQLRIGLELNFSVVIIGALLYAIAVAFEAGVKLREEQELTI